MRARKFPIVGALLAVTPICFGQFGLHRGAINETYELQCAACHGSAGEGGLGGSFLDGEWKYGSSDEEIAAVIRNGIPEMGMVPYGEMLDEAEIRALVVHLRELKLKHDRQTDPAPTPADGMVIASQHHAFRLERVATYADDAFWSVDFLPDGRLLLSGFAGSLLVGEINGELTAIEGLPEVWRRGQGGMLDIVAHPEFADNGWIYLSYAHSPTQKGGKDVGATRISRGRIKDGRWVDHQDLYSIDERFLTAAGVHFGCRLVFQNGYLFFGLGDRGHMQNAQQLDNPFGKIHRIHDDGRIPTDNPFVDEPGAIPSIWTYGNRNPQGLALRPGTTELWETEHGPRGGDEVNHLHAGHNYGWPVITHGINYNGKPITDKTAAPGMEQPILHWTPSIAVCGMDFLVTDPFPAWNGDLFTGGLSAKELHRIKLDGDTVIEREILFTDFHRVRDVTSGPDGYLYIVANADRHSGGQVFRLVPVAD